MLNTWPETTMSILPCELLDHTIDHLHNSQTSLRNCRLVSKSWFPRTRTHLFAEINFDTLRSLRSWKKTFRDPSTSPACYTKRLLVGSSNILAAANGEASSWIGGFSRVVRLELVGLSSSSKWKAALFLFRVFSPFVKPLRVNNAAFPPSLLFDLIVSFPLLEDLLIIDCYCTSDNGSDSNEASTLIQPSGPPMFTGSFVLFLDGGTWPIDDRASVVVPADPLPGTHLGVVLQGGYFADDGVGGKVFSYP